MTCLPPRKISTSSKTSKHDASPLQILLQMGFPKHRALKALAATGNRSVQLASDWLLTHVNDAYLDMETPREYILYACPTGSLLSHLLQFWEKSKSIGWNGAHNFPPHITLVSFFKAPDDSSLQLAKSVKHVIETVGDPPSCPLKLEPYMSHNFMGLFVSEEHADYLKKIAVQYVKQASSEMGLSVDTYEHLDALATCFPWCTVPQERPMKFISLEPHVKSLHITLAYHFAVEAYDSLKRLCDDMQPLGNSNWELRLYSRDPRFAKHQVYRVAQSYVPKENDELELLLGDYIYIDEKEIESSTDGWLQGTSWLTGVTGFLPAVYTQRTAESDAWTLHKAISLTPNAGIDSKSESDSATDGEGAMSANYPHSDAAALARDKSEETFKEWENYWRKVVNGKYDNVLVDNNEVLDGTNGVESPEIVNQERTNGVSENSAGRRWILAMRHGERVDLTYGSWVPFCFDGDGRYVRKDLNMPLTLPDRAGGAEAFATDSPLTRVGVLQATLVGEALRLVHFPIRYVYASAALRSVHTAHAMLLGMEADPSIKIRVEPGLFEYKMWHPNDLAHFMTTEEFLKAGYNVDPNYKPYVHLDVTKPESMEDFHKRNELAIQSAYRDTEDEGGNIIFIGHASTLGSVWQSLRQLTPDGGQFPPYYVNKILSRIPYCGIAAVRDKPWELVEPPCPPSINSSSGRFDWTVLRDEN